MSTTSSQGSYIETNTLYFDTLVSVHESAIEGVDRFAKLRLHLQRVDYDWWNVGYTGELRGLYVQLRDESRRLEDLYHSLTSRLVIVVDTLHRAKLIQKHIPLFHIGEWTMTDFSQHHSVCEALIRVSHAIQTEFLDKLDDNDQPEEDSSSSFWISERIDCASKVCRYLKDVDIISVKCSLNIEFSLARATLSPEAAGCEVTPPSDSNHERGNSAVEERTSTTPRSRSPDDPKDDGTRLTKERKLYDDWLAARKQGSNKIDFLRDRNLMEEYGGQKFDRLIDRVRKRRNKIRNIGSSPKFVAR